MPLSEEEQRILHEMEQKLYEHDRAFADRVSTTSRRPGATRATRWAVAAFVAGFAIMIVTFRSSVVIASVGFVIMLVAALIVVRQVAGAAAPRLGGGSRSLRGHGVGEEWSEMRRRMRSRFGNRD